MQPQNINILPLFCDLLCICMSHYQGLVRSSPLCVVQGDTKLWLQYIQFCQQLNQKEALGRVFGKVLAIHPNHVGEMTLSLFVCVCV